MSTKAIIAIILIAGGLIILAYSGISFTTAGEPVDILGLEIATTERHFISPLAGLVALVIGAILLVLPLRGTSGKSGG